MIPLTAIRGQSGPLSWVSPDDLAEWARRKKLQERALAGNEDALAELRDGMGLRTLMLAGQLLINDGVLVGAKP